jgi:hypothetical protein
MENVCSHLSLHPFVMELAECASIRSETANHAVTEPAQ